jgi:hypothetical protein
MAAFEKKISESQAAFETSFSVTGGYRKPEQAPLRGFLEECSQLVSDFYFLCKRGGRGGSGGGGPLEGVGPEKSHKIHNMQYKIQHTEYRIQNTTAAKLM